MNSLIGLFILIGVITLLFFIWDVAVELFRMAIGVIAPLAALFVIGLLVFTACKGMF